MRKTLTIAAREYRAMVATKAFLISLLVMPLLMFGGILAVGVMGRLTTAETLKIAVWDPDNQFFDLLQQASEARNAALDRAAGIENLEQSEVDSSQKLAAELDSDDPMPDVDRFLFERIDRDAMSDRLRLEFSDKVRRKELHAFVEIPAGIAGIAQAGSDVVRAVENPASAKPEPQVEDSATASTEIETTDGGNRALAETDSIRFFSDASGLDPAQRWMTQMLDTMVKQQRFAALGIDTNRLMQATQPLPIRSMQLVSQQSDGSVSSQESKDSLTALLLPMGIMLMMFMVIMMSAQPMLESVLEEKSQRIAEVLLGSCNPMQLMAGKLLGTVGGSLTIFALYAIGGYFFAANLDYLDLIPMRVLPWFFAFQILGVLFYSSIFLAIGSSVSQLKEAQSMMMPVWMLLMIPLLTWFVLVQKPDGALAFWLSLFPPTAPTVIMLRMSTGITVPLWEILLSLSLLIAATGFCVYLAGRIFRIGILWQGKAPKFTEMLGWAMNR